MHKHWMLWAYDQREPNGDLANAVSLEYIGNSWLEVLEKAQVDYQPYGSGSGYMLRQIIEHYDGQCIR